MNVMKCCAYFMHVKCVSPQYSIHGVSLFIYKTTGRPVAKLKENSIKIKDFYPTMLYKLSICPHLNIVHLISLVLMQMYPM